MMKSLKTPLRYPGGKSRAVTKMCPLFPYLSEYDEFREPFLGGGSVALYITKKYPHLDVWVNDLYEPLVNFWQQLQIVGEDLSERLQDYKATHSHPESARELFKIAKERVNDEEQSPFNRACYFYIINKCSFSGLTEASSFSKQASDSNFSLRGIEKLPEYSRIIKDWKITNESYETLLSLKERTFLYLDPPYDIKDNLYGRKGSMHKGFDHDFFALICDKNSMDMLISYNSDQLVKKRFAGSHWNTGEFEHTYTMRSVGEYMSEQKSRKELVLLNYDNPRT